MKVEERRLARELRSRGDISLKDIAKELNVSKGTVSLWVRDIELTPEQSKHLNLRGAKARNYKYKEIGSLNAERFRAMRREYQQSGRKKAKELDPIHMAGCMLYWCEGFRSNNRNRLVVTNSDINLVKFFIDDFLEPYFPGSKDKLTIVIRYYTDNNVSYEDIKKFWLEGLDLDHSQLRKSQVNKYPRNSRKLKKFKLPYGTVQITINNVKIIQHIYGAIQEYAHFENELWLG